MRYGISKCAIFVALLLCSIFASAQTTLVSATIVDPAGTPWGNSTWTATVISSLNPPVTFPGYNNFTTKFSGTANSAGLFTVNVQRVANIYPANSTWQFCVVSGVSYTQNFCVNVPVGNAGQSSQDISAQINAVLTIPVIPGGVAVRAYTDAEVPAVIGAIYFNVVMGNFRCFGSSWVNCGTGGGGGGAGFPLFQDVAAGKGDGTGVPMPEKPITVVGSNGFVQCDEDYAQGRFDARCPIYAGGAYGPTPGAAWQAFSDALVCYQGINSKHARTSLPPGTFAVGTDAHPTLSLPAGVIYDGGGGWGFGTNAVQFQATYNNHRAVDIVAGLTSTTNCSDGVPHTSTMGGGSYDGFSEHGCGQGGCHNVPGDNGNYPFGGPVQDGIAIRDSDGTIGAKSGVFASNNGADGVLCIGADSHCHEVGGSANNDFFIYGIDVAGQNYQFSAGECHGEVVLAGLDNLNFGPTETYGQFNTLGAEYGHIAGICWGGGLTQLGTYFVQLQEIGVIHMSGGNDQATAMSGRNDAAEGTGILEMGSSNTTWFNPRMISSCRFDGLNDYIVGTVTRLTGGTGQTPGTYVLTANSGAAQIAVTIAGGGTMTADPVVRVHGRGYTSTPPTFTLSAGGTPATFTVNMQSAFFKIGTGTPQNNSCSYLTDLSSGKNTYVAPLTINNGFFGTDHSTGDIYADSFLNTFIAPRGNGPSGRVKWDPNILAYPTSWQNAIIDADFLNSGGGVQVSGTTIDIAASGYHVVMHNTTPTRLTAVSNGLMNKAITIVGDGFTTMPYLPTIASGGGVFFGAVNCLSHDLLLQANRQYQFQIVAGQAFGAPVTLLESCDATFNDYSQLAFFYLAAYAGLPPTTTQATVDAAGAYAVRPLPPVPAIQVSTAGPTSGFNYCYAVEIWTSGGKQTTPLTCNTVTPVAVLPTNNVKLHLALPVNWTRYKVFMNSTTDPAFTPGVWYDVTTPNGLPQPASCDFGTVSGCVGLNGIGLFITPFTPTDTSTLSTPNLALNMTGTYNASIASPAIPASSNTLCVQGQQVTNVPGNFDYICDTEDHWVRSSRLWVSF